MLRVARVLLSSFLASALCACLSYPETITVEARDASVVPERPAQPIASAADGGDEGGSSSDDASGEPHPDASPPPPPPPDPKPCDECPPGTRCCTKGGKGKGKGGNDDGEIVCKPADAACD